jgi:prevent-host-death family protein
MLPDGGTVVTFQITAGKPATFQAMTTPISQCYNQLAKSGRRDITFLGNLSSRGRLSVDITKDIQPMTTFRNHSAEIMQQLKATKRPVILTVNGKAAAVVQDAEAYQHLLDLAAQASAAEGIRQGLEDLRNGRIRPAGEAFDEIRTSLRPPA